MKISNFLIKVSAVLLILCTLNGCSWKNNNYRDYDIIAEGTERYIILKNEKYINIQQSNYYMDSFGRIMVLFTDYLPNSGEEPNPIIFDSIEEMSLSITESDYSDEQMRSIASFPRDASGRTPICNPETLYAPIFPDTYDKYNIEWYGERYIAPIYDANSARKGYFVIVEQAPWEERISELQNYEQTLSSCAQVKHLVAEHNAQNNLSVYWYSKSDGDPTPSYKECVYSFTRGENTYFVREYYTLDTSETIPANIDIYGTAQGQCFYFYINATESRPSIDWLSQFGLKKYIYNSAA